MAVAAYPGTFNPPTVAHLAIACAAWRQARLERVDLVLSEVPLGKANLDGPPLADRMEILARVTSTRPWLGVRSTPAQLLADVAAGYDYLILGADKWAQVLDPVWYGGSQEARDEVLARIPPVLVAPRPPFPLPPDEGSGRVRHLSLAGDHGAVSSTAVRGGHLEWMLPEAAAYASRTGAWGWR